MLASFWTTTNCNLKCRYCYEDKSNKIKSISKDTVDKAIEFILNQKKINDELVVQIHGGEPFLEFETIKYIVNRIKDKSEQYNFNTIFLTTTNATIMNEEVLEFIVNEIPDITVSIDGCKATHDNNRITKNGIGTHDTVIKNSKSLLKYLPKLRVRMTFDTETIENLYEDVKYLIDEGFKVIVPVADLFEKRWDNKHVSILESQIEKMNDYINDKEGVLLSLVEANIQKDKGNCNGGVSSFHIYPDGKIYPCTLATGNDSFCIGDIYSGINIEHRDYLLSFSNNINADCDGCSIIKSCEGNRCKIINKMINDDFLSPPPMHCAIQNLKYKMLLKKNKK